MRDTFPNSIFWHFYNAVIISNILVNRSVFLTGLHKYEFKSSLSRFLVFQGLFQLLHSLSILSLLTLFICVKQEWVVKAFNTNMNSGQMIVAKRLDAGVGIYVLWV